MNQAVSKVHRTAIIAPGAELDPSVSVGPYAVIGEHVRIGAGTSVGAHCVIEGRTTIGPDNQIFQFASLGAAPQDKKYAGEPTRLEIGARNTIREFCTFNTGTVQDQGVTRNLTSRPQKSQWSRSNSNPTKDRWIFPSSWKPNP